MVMSKVEIGKLVREARIKQELKSGKKFTQQMLADAVRKSRSYIGDIESGRIYPNYVLLVEIAEACGVHLSFFGEMDDILDNIIKKRHPEMTPDVRNDFAKFISANLNQVDFKLDLDILKILYDDSVFNQEHYTEPYEPTEEDIAENDALNYAAYNNDVDKDMKAIMEALKNASPNKKAKILKMIELFNDEN
jgi:transcriptional regulator with XRE-family HTH domain